MARIKITDIPKNQKIGKKEMRSVHGGEGSFGQLLLLNKISYNDTAQAIIRKIGENEDTALAIIRKIGEAE